MERSEARARLERRLLGLVNLERSRAFHRGRVRFDLEGMRRLCERLGHPERRVPAVRVAGSKGKGSVSVFVAAILSAHGLKTGLHTSPHVSGPEERVAIEGAPLDPSDLLAHLEAVLAVVEGSLPTYFEAVTLAAFLAFAERADVAVHECGIGARLDATGVVPAQVGVLTSVEVEHAGVLGPDRRTIAADKAYVAGPGTDFVTGIRPEDEVFQVVEARCRIAGARLSAPPHLGNVDRVRCLPDGSEARLRAGRFGPATWRLRVWGRHQVENLLVALAAADRMLERLGVAPDVGAAREAVESVRLPARLEPMPRGGTGPLVVLDGAHTGGSIAAALRSVGEHLPGREPIVVLGLAADKDVPCVAQALAGVRLVVTTAYPGGRARDPSAVARLLRRLGIPAAVRRDPEKALAHATSAAEREGVVLVTGSLWLAGLLRARLGGAEVRFWSTSRTSS